MAIGEILANTTGVGFVVIEALFPQFLLVVRSADAGVEVTIMEQIP
jgi:hypothetical protein